MVTIDEILPVLQQWDIVGAITIFAISLAIAFAVKYTLKIIAWQLAKKTKTNLDDLLLGAIENPLVIGIILIGLYISSLTVNSLIAQQELIRKIGVGLGILWGAFTLIRVIKALFIWYEQELSKKTKSDFDDKYLHIIRRAINILILVMSALVFLHHLGIQISPLLAGLGIGGLAVALALQDSLGNFFAGFYTMTERAIKIGDYIETEAGVKGFVKDINWRTTKIQMMNNNMIIIPNSKLSQSIVTNFDSPNKHFSLLVPVGVSYDSDMDKVEKLAAKAARDVLKDLDELPKDSDPFVRYDAFGDSSINLNVILRLKNYQNRWTVKHEFMKRLKKEFDKNKIEIPFPQRVVHMRAKP